MATLKLNPYQQSIVNLPIAASIKVSAAAGAGKTATMTARYCFLVEQGIAPERIMVVTFSNAGAKPIQERIAQRVSLSQDAASQISTTNAMCYRLLKRDGCRLTIPDQNWKLTKILKEIAARLWPDSQARPGADELRAWLEAPKRRGLTSADDLAYFEEQLRNYDERGYKVDAFEWPKLLHRGRKLFDDALQQNGWLTFADQLYLVERRLIEDAEWRTALQARIDAVIVDEAQDTNFQDFRILGTIAAEAGCNAIYDAYNPRTGKFAS